MVRVAPLPLSVTNNTSQSGQALLPVAELRELLSRRRELVWKGREVRKEDILSRGRMQCGMYPSLSESRVMAGRLEKQAAASPWSLDSDAWPQEGGESARWPVPT